jgi:hypothetical protein
MRIYTDDTSCDWDTSSSHHCVHSGKAQPSAIHCGLPRAFPPTKDLEEVEGTPPCPCPRPASLLDCFLLTLPKPFHFPPAPMRAATSGPFLSVISERQGTCRQQHRQQCWQGPEGKVTGGKVARAWALGRTWLQRRSARVF